MTFNYKQLYKIQEATLRDISAAICEKRGLPYHEIPEVSLMEQISGLENLFQAVPNSMLANHTVLIRDNMLSGYFLMNNEQIAEADKMGCVPKLVSAETSNKPVFIYNLQGYTHNFPSSNGYYIGNYIT